MLIVTTIPDPALGTAGSQQLLEYATQYLGEIGGSAIDVLVLGAREIALDTRRGLLNRVPTRIVGREEHLHRRRRHLRDNSKREAETERGGKRGREEIEFLCGVVLNI